MAGKDPKPGGLDTTLAEASSPTPSPRPALRPGAGARGASGAPPAVAELPTIAPETYELGREVARGGMGRILSARDRRLGRTVAIKELHGGATGLQARFEREALITARLQHPAIVPVYEAGRWPGGEPFYAMKLVAGRSLKDVLADARTPAERLTLLAHVLTVVDALAYAHGERIIHRDLKPANVLVGSFGETVVIDWGLAKDLDAGEDDEIERSLSGRPTSSEELTLAGSVLGTPAYMPPEQAAGRPVDQRADVYALGAILYHVLAGEPPYAERKSAAEVLAASAAGPPLPLEGRFPGLPHDLIAIVEKAMARQPADRYPTARELADELRRFQTGQLVASHRYTRWELMRRFMDRHRAVLVVVALSLAVLATALTLGFQRILRERDRAERERASAQQRADQLTLGQARAELDKDPAEALALLRTLSHGASVWPAARVIAADAWSRGVPRVLRGHERGVNHVAVSPDGRFIASASDDATVRLWAAASGEARVLRGHTDPVVQSAFSPDGKQLATLGQDGGVRVWNVETGTGRLLGQHHGWVNSGMWSPDGRLLATTGTDGAVRLWEVASGEVRELVRHSTWSTTAAFSHDGKLLVSASLEQTPRVWEVASGKLLHELPGLEDAYRLQFSPDDRRIAGSGRDKAVFVWPASGGAPLVLSGHESIVFDLAFSPDGKQLASGSFDKTVRLWDLDGGPSRTFTHDAEVMAVRFSPDGSTLASSDQNGAVRLWDLASGHERELDGHAGNVYSLTFMPDGRALVSASSDRTVRVWPFADPSGRVLRRGGKPVALALAPDDRTLAVVGLENALTLVDLHTDDARSLPSPDGWLVDVVFAPGGAKLVTVSLGKQARVWDLANRTSTALGCRARLGVRWSQDGRFIAAPAADQAGVCLWSVADGTARFLSAGRWIGRVRFSPDGTRLAGADASGTILIWRTDGTEESRLVGHQGEVNSLAYSPDGRTLASSGDDSTVRLWPATGGDGVVLARHHGAARALAFSPDGRLLATVGADRIRRVWDVATRTEALPPATIVDVPQTMRWSGDGSALVLSAGNGELHWWDARTGEGRLLRGHHAGVRDLAVGHDGRLVVSCSHDGTVHVWRDSLPDQPAMLRAWLARHTPGREAGPGPISAPAPAPR